MPKISKRALVAKTRREYETLKRAYHAVGKRAMGKPSGSKVKRDYRTVQAALRKVGSRLGKLTGVHKGR